MSVCYGFKVEDLINEGRLKEEDLKTLREWLETQPLPHYTDNMLALFFMACKNDIENTKKCAKAYYFARRDAPELFNERDLSRNDIQLQLKILDYCVMPQRTEDGCVVALHRLVDTDASQYHMEVAMKVLFMTMDTALYDNPPKGLIVLFDMKGVGLKHLTRIKFSAVKKFFYYVQEGLPLELRAIHVMNVVWFFDKIFKLISPLVKPEVLELLHLHQPNINMEEFYVNCISKQCLPSDYGGLLKSVRELHTDNEKKMNEMQDYFVQEQILRSL